MQNLFVGTPQSASITANKNWNEFKTFYPIHLWLITDEISTDISAHADSKESALSLLRSIRDDANEAIRQLEMSKNQPEGDDYESR